MSGGVYVLIVELYLDWLCANFSITMKDAKA